MFNRFHKHGPQDRAHPHAHPHGDSHHHHAHLLMGRMRGGRGFGHFAAGFMGGGADGEGFRAGRKLGSGDLQLLILALLADKPAHGYELIKRLEERSAGFYSPSPGMIYPALTYLEEIGHATVVAQGAKKLYEITDEGRAHLEANRSTADTIFSQLERIGRKMADVRRVFSGERPGDGEEAAGESPVLRQARHELKSALRQKQAVGPEEVQRIAEILREAAAKILGD